jgi:hypothetical protein
VVFVRRVQINLQTLKNSRLSTVPSPVLLIDFSEVYTELKHENCGEIVRLIGGFCIIAVCTSDTEGFVTYWNYVNV